MLADLEPVREVVAHVVAAEGQHGHGIAAQLSDFAGGSRGGLAARGRAEERSVLPVESLGHQGHDAGAASAKQDRVNRNALADPPTRAQSTDTATPAW